MDSKCDFKRFLITLAVGLLVLWYGAGGVYAADYTWDDGGSDSNWSTPENWNPDGPPGPGDNVIFDSTSNTDCIADEVVDNLASISLNPGFTSALTLNSDFVGGSNELTLTGDLNVNSGIILCKGDTSTANGTGIIINAANVLVDTNGKISADSQGFVASEGLGAGFDAAGAGGGGYGGQGGACAVPGGPTYGSLTQPTALGSGGGNNGASLGGVGGGAIKINASGTVTINGTISANGGNAPGGRAGGGSGGSIWIIADTLTGNGAIATDGGNGHLTWNSGGGGGGRIALDYNTKTYTGTIRASGGTGKPSSNNGHHGTLSIDFDGNDLTISADIALAPGTYNIPNFTVTNSATLECQADIDGDPPYGSGVFINATNVTIDEGACISVNGQGFPASDGPGAGFDAAGAGGGGYGGYGGACAVPGGVTYGSVTEPTALGSGGGNYSATSVGGVGGGAVKINASGTVTINGTISANGENAPGGRSGGGSGGSIWIIADTIAGIGAITADGGDGHLTWDSAGGAGGRIALDYTTKTYTGTIRASGGVGRLSPYRGHHGTLSIDFDGNDLIIRSDIALAAGTYNIPSLTITGNATLECQGDNDGDPGNGSGVTINATNVTVDAGACLSANGQGFPASEGPGAGFDAAGAGGGGYGGQGGACAVSGGVTYGSPPQPIALGSGGGNNGGAKGGVGGGAIKINALGTVTINGTISANGKNGCGGRTAGGSGGSIWIIADTLKGAGAINAVGGNGHPTWASGGGGGGRIAIRCSSSPYIVTSSVTGGPSGAGGQDGTSGTVVWSPVGGYTQENEIPQAQCVQSTDGEGMENGIVTISFKVRDPGDEINGVSTLDLAEEIIVNDSEAAFVDGDKSWSSNTAGYGGDQHWAETDAGGSNLATCTWTFNVSETGNYNVYAWWVRSTNRAKDAPYTIYYNRGLENETVDVNQEGDGSCWYYLGTYYFTGDSSEEKIVLTNDADEYVMADAIRLLPAEYEIIVDDTQATFAPSEGDWTFPLGAGYGGSHYKAKGDGSATCTWAFNVCEAGNYYVYAWWPQGGNRTTDTPYTINYNGGSESDIVRVNQQENGSQWNYLGTYYFTGGGSEDVVLSNDATTGTYVMADAVRLVSTALSYKTDECTLHSFEYSVNGGAWQAPRNGDSSLCLGGGWPDNNGANYPAFNIFADTTEQSFTWDILHYDLAGIFEDHREAENVRIRFKVRNTITQDDDTYYIDSVSYVLSESFEIIDPFGLGPAEPTPDSSSDDGGNGGCFIATAAYGSYMEPHVMILRSFRDTHLIPWALGRTLVRKYYKYSPPLARFISRHEILKGVVRASLLPLVAVSYAALHFGPVITITMIVVLLVIPIFIVLFYQLHRHQNKGIIFSS